MNEECPQASSHGTGGRVSADRWQVWWLSAASVARDGGAMLLLLVSRVGSPLPSVGGRSGLTEGRLPAPRFTRLPETRLTGRRVG